MAFLAAIPWWVPTVISAAGTIFSAVSQARAGQEQEAALGRQAEVAQANAARQAQAQEFQAEQLETIAQQERASAGKAAAEERRRSRVVQSRALALAAAGGGASDPTVVNVISDLAGEGEYLAALRIYEGEESARRALTGADAARYEGASGLAAASDVATGLRSEGAARRRAGLTGAASTIFSGVGRSASMYGRYGQMETPGLVSWT